MKENKLFTGIMVVVNYLIGVANIYVAVVGFMKLLEKD